MFFIGFPFFLPHSTTRHNYWIYQTICQAKPSKFIIKLYTNQNILLVKHGTYKNVERLRATSLSKSDNTVHNNPIFNTKWIIYKMVGALSFPQPYLCLQPLLQSPAKIRSPILVNFHLHIPTLLVNKIIFTIPTNTPFLYTSAIFYLPIFAYSNPYNLYQKCFSYLSHVANSGFVKRPMSKEVLWGLKLVDNWHCFSLSLLHQSIDREVQTGLTITDSLSLLIPCRLWWRYLHSEWKTIQSTFPVTRNLFPLILYPTNTITRTQIPLWTSCLTWFSL